MDPRWGGISKTECRHFVPVIFYLGDFAQASLAYPLRKNRE